MTDELIDCPFGESEEECCGDPELCSAPPAQQYQNVGTTRVLGHAPGETFTADIPEAQERQLLLRHLVRVTPPSPPVQPKSDDESTSQDKE